MNTDQEVDQAIALLRSSSPETRERAVETLGRIGSDRAREALLRALGDKESRVRQWAAWALGQIYSSTSLNIYFTAHRDDLVQYLGDEEARLLEQIALGEKQPPRSHRPPGPHLPPAPPAPFRG